ncbi:hypothetical protein [Candidatus Leptofilum sp.]|uniref:hypothetical protein n=1 Tax=Candidatus Leptofilum sp. TaxID=3241576 RepID=UPI003B5B7D85
MESTIFIIYGLIQLVLLGLGLQIWSKTRRPIYLILPLVSAALVYDNFVIGLGLSIGEGSTLEALNSVRFISHALFTPLLSLYGLRLSRNAGLDWSWRKNGATAVYVIVGALVLLGIYLDIISLTLEPIAEGGTLRYVNTGWEGPPITAIMTMAVLLFIGFSMIVTTRWVWLLFGSLTMFIISGFAATLGIVANFGEILLIVSLIATARHFPHQTKAEFEEKVRLLTPAEKKELASTIRARKKRLAVHNRRMAWVMLPVLIIGTVAFYRDSLNMSWIPAWVDYTFNTLFILLFFIHAVASFYFYGVPKPRRHIRVTHVYIGYGVFLFTLISQSLIGVEPIHLITYIINWVFIGAHVVLSTYFMLKRNQKAPVESLDIRVKVKETTLA